MMTREKLLVCAGLMAAAADAGIAEDFVRVEAPEAGFAGGEASVAAALPEAPPGALPEAPPGARVMRIELSLPAQGGAEAEFGAGPDMDWQDPDAASVAVALEDGKWVVRGDRLRRRFEAPAGAPGPDGRRTLRASVDRRGPGGRPAVTFSEAGGGVLENLAGVPAEWFGWRGWDSMLLTARGAPGARASVGCAADGTVLIVR
jgi:hypothetical protein